MPQLDVPGSSAKPARARWSPVERRRRAAARQALYSSLVLVGLAGWATAVWVVAPTLGAREQAWARVDYGALREVQLLADYVRIDTSPSTGSEVPGIQFLAEQLRRAGIPSTVDLVDAKHANLWAVIEGERPEAVVLHHHVDVSDADPATWSFPAYDALIKGPWIRGRGTFDMKSVGIAQLLSFLDVHALGTRPKRSLILLATSAEEHGSVTGMRRVLAQQPELVKRFGVFLTEGGAVEARSLDDIKYWGIEFAQRRLVSLTAHAPEARLEALRQALIDRGHLESAPRVSPETRAFLAAYAGSRDLGDFRELFSDPDRLVGDPARFAKAPIVVRDLLVDTVLLSAVRRASDGGFELPIGLLLLPDTDAARAREEFLPATLLEGVEIAVEPETTSASPRGSSLSHPAYLAMQQILRERSGGAPVGPYMLGHTLTDSRFVRPLGIPAYGFSPFLLLSVDTYRVDKADERIGLPGYVEGVETYRTLVRRLVDDPKPWE